MRKTPYVVPSVAVPDASHLQSIRLQLAPHYRRSVVGGGLEKDMRIEFSHPLLLTLDLHLYVDPSNDAWDRCHTRRPAFLGERCQEHCNAAMAEVRHSSMAERIGEAAHLRKPEH